MTARISFRPEGRHTKVEEEAEDYFFLPFAIQGKHIGGQRDTQTLLPAAGAHRTLRQVRQCASPKRINQQRQNTKTPFLFIPSITI